MDFPLKYLASLRPSHYPWMFSPSLKVSLYDEMAEKGTFPLITDLYPALFWFFGFSITRFISSGLLIKPFAMYCLRISSISMLRNRSIDSSKIFRNAKKKLSTTQVEQLSAESGVSIEECNAYLFNHRQITARLNKITKFEEAFWRFVVYTVMVIAGLYALFYPTTAPWIIDSKEQWRTWPFDPVRSAILLYYVSQLGLYFHFLAWTEVQRSDALEMLIHHIVTIGLIVFSYLAHIEKIGSLIPILHDISDVFLEAAKLFNYVAKIKGGQGQWAQPFCDGLFAVFAISFFICRLVLFPRAILWAALFDGPMFLSHEFAGYYVLCGLAITLQCLHVFWFFLIARMAVTLFTTGIQKDIRSDDEEEDAPTKAGSAGSSKDD